MKMGKVIGLTYDLKSDRPLTPDDPIDANAELDTMETVEFIMSALKSGGHRVVPIGNVHNLLRQIDELDVDIVLNICEGHAGRNRESQVPLILEMKGIPFVGSDALTMGITLDKIAAKKCFIADGIPTPRYFNAYSTDNLEKLNTIGYPLIVKARYEGTSKGLSEQSRVEDFPGLKRQVELINKRYKQAALVEKFIRGTEFTVPVLGNENPQAMPVSQIAIDGSVELGDKFYTFPRVVNENAVRYLCPPRITKELEKKLQDLAVRAYQSVDCRDLGRVDFRVDAEGNLYVLEINPLPSLAKKDVFNIFPQVMETTYEAIINTIVNFALKRYGMLKDSSKGQQPFIKLNRGTGILHQ